MPLLKRLTKPVATHTLVLLAACAATATSDYVSWKTASTLKTGLPTPPATP